MKIENFALSYGPAGQPGGIITQVGDTISLAATGGNRYTIDVSAGSDFSKGRVTIYDTVSLRYPLYRADVGKKDSSGAYENPTGTATLLGYYITPDQSTLVATYSDDCDGTTRTRTHTYTLVGKAVRIEISAADGSTEVNSNYCGVYGGTFSGSNLQMLDISGTQVYPTAYIHFNGATQYLAHFMDISQSHAQEFSLTNPASKSTSATYSTLNRYVANTAGEYEEPLREVLWCISSDRLSDCFVHPNDGTRHMERIAKGPWCFLTSKGPGWANHQSYIESLANDWGFDALSVYPQWWWAKPNFITGSQENGSNWQPGDADGQAAFGTAVRALNFNVAAYTYPSLEVLNAGNPAGSLIPNTYDEDARVVDNTGAAKVSVWGEGTPGMRADTISGAAGQVSQAKSGTVAIFSEADAEIYCQIFAFKQAGEIRIDYELQNSSSVATEQMTVYVDTDTGNVRSVTSSVTGGGGYSADDVDVNLEQEGRFWVIFVTLADHGDSATKANMALLPYETGGTTVGARDIIVWEAGIYSEGRENAIPQANRSDFSTWTLTAGATVTTDTHDEPVASQYMRKTELVADKFAEEFASLGELFGMNAVRYDVDTYASPIHGGGDYIDAEAGSPCGTLKGAIQERRRWMYACKKLLGGAEGFAFGEGGRASYTSDFENLWAGAVDANHVWFCTSSGYDEPDPSYPEARSISNWPMLMEYHWLMVNRYFMHTNNNQSRFFTIWESGLQTTPPGPTVLYPFSQAMMDRLRCYVFLLRRTGGLYLVNDWEDFMAQKEVIKEYYLANAYCREMVRQAELPVEIHYHDDTNGYETETEKFDRAEATGTGNGIADFIHTRVRITQGTATIYVNRSSTDWVIPGILDSDGVTLPEDGYLMVSGGKIFGSFESALSGDVRVDVAYSPGEYLLVDGRGSAVTFMGITPPNGLMQLIHHQKDFTLTEQSDGSIVRS